MFNQTFQRKFSMFGVVIFLLIQNQVSADTHTELVSSNKPSQENKSKLSSLEVHLPIVGPDEAKKYYTHFKFTRLDSKTGKPSRSKQFNKAGSWPYVWYSEVGQRYILIEQQEKEVGLGYGRVAYFLEKEERWVFSKYNSQNELQKYTY